MDTNSPEAWFRNLPIVTRSLLVMTFSSTCLVAMGMLDPYHIILDWKLVTSKYHIWRVLTSSLFLGGFSFGFVMQLYFLTNFGAKLEQNQRFSNSPGEYLFFLIVVTTFVAILSLLIAWPRGYPLTGPSVIFAVIYYWSRCEPEAPLSIWGFQVKGYQLPFALIFVTLLMGGDIWRDILGLAAGHLYHFLRDVVPVVYRVNLLKSPKFFINFVDSKLNPPRAFRQPIQQPPPQNQPRMFGGGGYSINPYYTNLPRNMSLLRRSRQLRRQFPMPGSNDYIKDWEMYPPSTYGAALQPVDALLRKGPKPGHVLRGSGIHGPESSDVFKHILWNRMKQKRPERHLPNLEQLQDESKMNLGFLWFAIGLALVHQPVMAWAERYAAVHDHYPWMQKRVDGTKGKGQYTWYLQ